MEKSLFANFKAVITHHRKRFAFGVFFVVISNALLIINPLIFREAVNFFDTTTLPRVNPAIQWMLAAFPERTSSLPLWIVILLLVSLASALFKYWMRVEFITISREAEKTLRSLLFSRIQEQSMAFLDRHGTGELISRLTNDIATYREVLGPGIMYPIYFASLIVPAMIALFAISVPLALISLLPIVVLPALIFIIRPYIYRLSKETHEKLAEMSNLTQECYSGIRIIKSYAVEKTMQKKFRKECHTLANLKIRLNAIEGLFFPFLVFLTKLVTVLLVGASGVLLLWNREALSTADFVSFMWVQSYIFIPVLMLGWVLPIYHQGRAAYDRLLDVYEEPIEVHDVPSSPLIVPPRADIAFKNLTFFYPNNTTSALTNITLTIKGESFVGITGPVAAGKTTLFRLLNREYEIPREMIFIGSEDIRDYSLEALRKEMATVEQSPILFSKTIAENISFGYENTTQTELEQITKLADIHETILSFPSQYETLVGERGVTLSGGQKQRVAIARALFANRQILLLDDIFAAVDTETEENIFSSIKENRSGKTILLITHRVPILERVDRILYIDRGKILEDGTHNELMAKKGPYAALVELQKLK